MVPEKDRLQYFPFKGEAVYMATYQPFLPIRTNLADTIVPAECSAPQTTRQPFAGFLGTHNRGTRTTDGQPGFDTTESARTLFETIDKELEANAELSVFLATDSEAVKADMRKRYGKRILTAEAAADRNSVSGIQDGILDLYTLAGTRRIYGSFRSSFSELAAELGNIPLTTVLKK